MTHLSLGFVAVCGFAASLSAQTPQSAQPQRAVTDAVHDEATVSGCLTLGAQGEFLLQRTEMQPETVVADDQPTGTAGSVSELTSGQSGRVVVWKLKGGPELIKYVLQRVEVKGPLVADPAASGPVGTSGTIAANTRDRRPAYQIDVRSVKVITPSCAD